ncbi:hypothetical protein TWF703_006887 [Orbilia oligospora]|uniref:Uncharacterized protein n=1 Tax=Orbilia oligospora TaxID=2813651 RepID=A0A7C8JW41_ORBOL|nr:hypothetical protein TWF703_006887 [Orbilia oligospora]
MPSEAQDPKVLYIYLSLSAGSSTIDTGLRVLERILKANKIPFSVIDISTDDKARSIWTRRKGPKQKLPAAVPSFSPSAPSISAVKLDKASPCDTKANHKPNLRQHMSVGGDFPCSFIQDFTEVEEWNEYGELKQKLGLETPSASSLPQTATTTTVDKKPEDKQAVPSGSVAIAAEAAAAAAKKTDQN